MEKVLPKKPQNFSLHDAMKFRADVIYNWTPLSDVWAFKHGDEILGTISTFGSIYITHVFRRELKIRPFATLTCYMPIVGLSALTTALFQSTFITSNILRKNSCPTCVSTRSVIGELFFGLVYPLVMSPIICFYMADRLLTYPIPPVRRAPKELFALYKKILMKNPRPFYIIGAIHAAAAIFITSQKYENLRTLEEKTRY